MKILVTGSSGTIGTRLCEKLLEKGYDVIGADREECRWQKAIEEIRIDCDLLSRSNVEKLPKDVDLVIHLAANARVYELVEHPERAMENFTTTFNVLEFVRTNGIKKFMFASSRETYGNIKVDDAYSEDKAHFMSCESPYTASKIGGEALTEAYKRCYGIEAIIFRFSNVYGMYDDSERVVPLFFRQARDGKPLKIFGKDKCLDFTYIDDCVEGILRGMEKWESAKNDTYNLAFGEGATILHLAERIKELLGSDSKIEIGSPRTGEVIRYIADISKAKGKLGYDPRVPFDTGIEMAVEWYTKNT